MWRKLKSIFFKSTKGGGGGGSSSSTAADSTASFSANAQSSAAADPPPPRPPASETAPWFSSRLSRSFSLHSSSRTCAICLRSLKKGQGQAIFYAECSHPFHFKCIAESVKHGNTSCPICRSKWKDLPFQAPITTNVTDPQRNVMGRARISPYNAPPRTQIPPEAEHFSDDEPISHSDASPTHQETLSVNTFPEYPAIQASDNVCKFGVLVHIKAPPVNEHGCHNRAPIDLVAVLDVSGSMVDKLALLKQAVKFIIQNLTSSDRFSIVAFSSEARKILSLRRMTRNGQEDAVRAINSLFSDGGTNIVAGLNKGVKILEKRHVSNPIASIILLSDGQDVHFNCSSSEYLKLLPPSICPNNAPSGGHDSQLPQTFPVHTFGFGLDHDSITMHAIADISGGTFSFIESSSILQDGFARCIGGLLTTVAQDVRLNIETISSGVQIVAIPSGSFRREILDQGRQGRIDVGYLYAEEEKEFLLYVSVPAITPDPHPKESSHTTPLVNVSCRYKNLASSDTVHLEDQRVVIQRPLVLSPTDQMVSLEVDRQRNRLFVAEGIAEAQKLADVGNFEGARELLFERRKELLSSASAQAGDNLCNWLEAELREVRKRMAGREEYDRSGRAYVLSGLCSHSWQRATTRGQSTTLESAENEAAGSSASRATITYETPSMTNMVTYSQVLQVALPKHPRRIHKSASLIDRR